MATSVLLPQSAVYMLAPFPLVGELADILQSQTWHSDVLVISDGSMYGTVIDYCCVTLYK